MRQAVYQIIEVSVTYAQFPEPRELLKGFGIYFLAHQFRALTPAFFPDIRLTNTSAVTIQRAPLTTSHEPRCWPDRWRDKARAEGNGLVLDEVRNKVAARSGRNPKGRGPLRAWHCWTRSPYPDTVFAYPPCQACNSPTARPRQVARGALRISHTLPMIFSQS
jgi:hypothetical protein